MPITTIAGTAGRITGTITRGLIWAHRTINWAEVAAIVLHGLQVLIVLALLAGRATRRLWDALPGWSEQLGQCYRHLLVSRRAPTTPPAVHPLQALATELEQLSRSDLQRLAGSRRRLAKAQLISMALAC
jgi:hypothetical protein